MKKIAIFTSSRAEYGLLKLLIKKMINSNNFKLFLIVSGQHLLKEYGETVKEIENDGFEIYEKIRINLKDDNNEEIVKSMASLINHLSKTFKKINPDLLILLGDRYELLYVSSSALIYSIPIAHIHGGEITSGAFDDSIRHSITKLSCIHFVATNEYKNRVIQLGENPSNVVNVGGLGVDAIKNTKILNKSNLETLLGHEIKSKNFLVTLHPETLSNIPIEKQINTLLFALKKYIHISSNNLSIIFTGSNSDPDATKIRKLIKKFVKQNRNCFYHDSLGQEIYYSTIKFSSIIIGNSSSGILEVPTFKKPTINIGDRQKGRVYPLSVINCNFNENEIFNSILKAFDSEFIKICKSVKNPYGNGGASKKIIEFLKRKSLKNINFKIFRDILLNHEK